jgi:hypothetical protein
VQNSGIAFNGVREEMGIIVCWWKKKKEKKKRWLGRQRERQLKKEKKCSGFLGL